MKALYSLCLLILLLPFENILSQNRGFNYQAVIRSDGNLQASSSVRVTFIIHEMTPDGDVVFEES
ncbi:MAG: hypothetical protein AAFY41_13705, partial [Bacteroidota bacterium]